MCEGYNRGAVFLNRTVQGWEKRKRLEEARPRDSWKDVPFFSSINEDRSPSKSYRFKTPEQLSFVQQSVLQVTNINIDRQMFQSLFLENYLPSMPKQGLGLAGTWLCEAIQLGDPGIALDCSLHALCMTRAGRITGHQDLIKRGNAAYGSALRALFLALGSKELAGKDETLAACLILSIYEVVRPIIFTVSRITGFSYSSQLLIRQVLTRDIWLA